MSRGLGDVYKRQEIIVASLGSNVENEKRSFSLLPYPCNSKINGAFIFDDFLRR